MVFGDGVCAVRAEFGESRLQTCALVSSEEYVSCVSLVLVALGSVCAPGKAGRTATCVPSVPYHSACVRAGHRAWGCTGR